MIIYKAMSKLTRLEEVALSMSHAQVVAGYEEINMVDNMRNAHNFLQMSKKQFSESEFNKPDINGIEVVRHVEVKSYGIIS